MRRLETQAFVLRRFPATGKTDISLAFFTEKEGKLFATAKGAHSPRSKRSGALDSGNIVALELSETSYGWYVRQAELVSRLSVVKETMEKSVVLLLALSVLDTLLPIGQPEPQIYRSLLALVRRLAVSSEPRDDVAAWIRNAMPMLGYPSITGTTIADILVAIEQIAERPYARDWQFLTEIQHA